MMADISYQKNYIYWKNNGSFWLKEYIRRKLSLLRYSLQELTLRTHFEHCAPARVLEFGCGVGRHLSYLRNIPGIDIYGFDQSPTMLQQVNTWAEKEWMESHICLGEANKKLPYKDKSFDIVYSAEVLIHISPEDIFSRLKEMLRLARWHILHLEPPLDYPLSAEAHNGCWAHDLRHLYEELGYTCVTLPQTFSGQIPWLVVLDAARPAPYFISATFAETCMAIERRAQPEMDELWPAALKIQQEEQRKRQRKTDALQAALVRMALRVAGHKAAAEKQLEQAQGQNTALEHRLSETDTALQTAQHTCHAARNGLKRLATACRERDVRLQHRERFLRALHKGSHRLAQRYAQERRYSGWLYSLLETERKKNTQLDQELRNIRQSISFRFARALAFSMPGKIAFAALRQMRPAVPRQTTSPPSAITPLERMWRPIAFTPVEREWLQRMTRIEALTLSLGHPQWRGIRSSSQELFEHCYFSADDITPQKAHYLTRLFVEAGVRRLVVQGFPPSYEILLRHIHKHARHIDCYAMWHGSAMQFDSDHEFFGFKKIIALAREGIIKRVGFVKYGDAEVCAKLGVAAAFVMNFVKKIPETPSRPNYADTDRHVGNWTLWHDWRKIPYAQMEAVALLPHAVLHMTAYSRRVKELANFLGIKRCFRTSPVPQQDMAEHLASMHLNLYVTQSECAPMLPLESLAEGVPCLFGPNNHYFMDDDYLRSRLMVAYPETPRIIAEYMERALAERDAIISAYRRYAPSYNEQARQSVRDFLE